MGGHKASGGPCRSGPKVECCPPPFPEGSSSLTFTRTSRSAATLLAATSLAIAAPDAAAPATGPNRYLAGSDLINLEVAADQQISPDGRTIGYGRKSNDIMTDSARYTIWLVH